METLLPAPATSSQLSPLDESDGKEARQIVNLPISSVHETPENWTIYRKPDASDQAWIDLCASVREHGVREAITVSRDLYIISGHRRYLAAVSALRVQEVLTAGRPRPARHRCPESRLRPREGNRHQACTYRGIRPRLRNRQIQGGADRKFRFSPLDPAAIDRASRTIPVSFSSEHPAMQRHNGLFPEVMEAAGIKLGAPYVEILDHDPDNVDLSLLKNRGAFLDQHDEKDQLGVVEDVEIVDHVGRAVIRMGSDQKATKRFNQMAEGVRPHISAGYRYTKFLGTETLPNGRRAYRFATRMLEISSVAAPNDPTVGVARDDFFMRNTSLLDTIVTEIDRARSGSRRSDLDFSDIAAADLIMQAGRKPTGRCREMHEAIPFIGPNRVSRGVHLSALVGRMTRDMQASVFPQGGAFVPTELSSDVTRLAFNRSVLVNSGVEILDGQTSNYARVKVTSGPTVQTLDEVAPLTPSDILAMQDELRPCRITAQVKISRQLLMQGGPAADDAIKTTLRGAISAALDSACLFGQGTGDQVLGLFNVPGVGSLVWGGQASWGEIVAAEQALADANLDFGKMSWAVSPSTRARWKQIPRIAATNFPRFLIEDGKCNEYPVLASGQLSGQHLSVFAM